MKHLRRCTYVKVASRVCDFDVDVSFLMVGVRNGENIKVYRVNNNGLRIQILSTSLHMNFEYLVEIPSCAFIFLDRRLINYSTCFQTVSLHNFELFETFSLNADQTQ